MKIPHSFITFDPFLNKSSKKNGSSPAFIRVEAGFLITYFVL